MPLGGGTSVVGYSGGGTSVVPEGGGTSLQDSELAILFSNELIPDWAKIHLGKYLRGRVLRGRDLSGSLRGRGDRGRGLGRRLDRVLRRGNLGGSLRGRRNLSGGLRRRGSLTASFVRNYIYYIVAPEGSP